MVDSIYSPSWYRVADLIPRLRSHVEIHRHDYQGRVWYVLQDSVSGRSHRFAPEVYHVIGLMNGRRTVQAIWDAVTEQAGDKAPVQDEVIRLLGQLHSADVLITNATPDSRELFQRYQRQQRAKLKQRLWTPLAIRIPLLDPDKFLEKTLPVAKLFLNRYAAVVWIGMVLTALLLAITNWSALTENIVDRVITPENVLLIFLIYPFVKALHELGHAYLAKMYGAEVHEIGIMFLVLIPVPYVDVTSTWAFRDKRERMLVGAAGIGVELVLGALALFFWLTSEQGVAHALAYNVIVISGVSTLLFNGNPLLRFDGYFVLADALEIPNLGNRANQYWKYLAQRYLFGQRDEVSPADSRWERGWFRFYGLAAFMYRMYIMFVIVLYIGGKFFAIGVMLAIWAVVTQTLVPIGKVMAFFFKSPKLKGNRWRANLVSLMLVGGIVALVFVVPAPYWTKIQGVTWPSEKSQVRAGTDGFVIELLAQDRQQVAAGEPILRTEDPLIRARVEALAAQVKQLQLQLRAARSYDQVAAALVREELKVIAEDLKRAQEREAALVILSPRDGTLIYPNGEDLTGRFVRQGTLVGFVIEAEDHGVVRAAVPQAQIGLVREGVEQVDVMLNAWNTVSYPGEMVREIHGGTHRLPAAALGSTGGGALIVAPNDPDGLTTLERVFEIEVSLPPEARTEYLGARMNIRLDHGEMPLGLQAWRALRQLFLRQFGV